MSAQEKAVRIVVEESGVNFEVRNLLGAGEKGGFGLFSILEGLRILGGVVETQSSPGLGTCVALDVPIGREDG